MVRKVAQDQPADDAVAAAKEVFAGNIESVDDVYTDTAGNPLGLYARISRIIQSLPDMQPEGKNSYFNYKFITDKQVLGTLRPRMARQKILIIPETVHEYGFETLSTSKGGTSYLTKIEVIWRVVDGLTGESFTGQSLGYGDDSGDKGANKAYTAAYKNFLIKLFDIGGDTDIEEDEGTDRRAKAREAGSERVTKVEVGEAVIEGVERGGKASKATDAQIARVGQYARDLQLSADNVAAVISRVLKINVNLGEEPWQDVKAALESLTGKQIGTLIAALDEILQSTTNGGSDNE